MGGILDVRASEQSPGRGNLGSASFLREVEPQQQVLGD